MENNQTCHIKIILVDLIFNVLLHHCVVNFKHINITIADQRPCISETASMPEMTGKEK